MTPPSPVSGFRLLLYTVFSIIALLLITNGVVFILARQFALPLGDSTATLTEISQRQQLRFILLINNVGTWGLSAMLALSLAFGAAWSRAARLVPVVRPQFTTPAVLAFLLGLPLIALGAYLNLQLDLPDWMDRSEATGNTMLAGILTFEILPELLMALLTVAVVPALCEELMFRGLIQGQLLPRIMGGHAAVWVAAAIFSAIHIEFAGFVPRLLLSALLGYAFRWTGSLWVPIALHLLFNGSQVISTYWSGEFTADTEMDTPFMPLLIAGTISLGIVGYLIVRSEKKLRGELASTRPPGDQ
ncbi:CPBP family intramembrane glutamic endopeptidase [Neolewinella litorea]|uniref:CPBP family intramembrane metalloprotease n=1 Tax=Neolewinella litorea TaxID=2562452 RepID=A0A4S4NPW5_9BACT|nr:CPBP family intramembrane glutamic endopeptidase [Neolewinella litorea]THH41125.1 CPBP family intramembrane metalloprotease [Neolewinella litorea]